MAATSPLAAVLLLGLLAGPAAQQVGTLTEESGPKLQVGRCAGAGDCTAEEATVTLDANWRWVHEAAAGGFRNCYTGGEWDPELCPDPQACAQQCAVEGVDAAGYAGSYGVSTTEGGIGLGFVTKGNVGSRVYVLDGDNYKLFKLKNRELTLTVETSSLPCGLNGAVYLVEMAGDGGMVRDNKAGAKYGTGYCDAQCPHDLKFMDGEANILDWKAKTNTGHYGMCCAELDIWEANSVAAAFTPHPCSIEGPSRCEGIACGDGQKGERYMGVCDKDGCDFNSYRMGDETYYGPGQVVDSKLPITVVTQFLTTDGTDEGDLSEIRRFYVQDGKVIGNSNSSVTGVDGNSITDKFCNAQKKTFSDPDDHQAKGGLKKMGEALDRGMVLVLSLWDDGATHMHWLNSAFPVTADPTAPGVLRGPCSTDSGEPSSLREEHPTAHVEYTDIKYGEIGSTFRADGRRLGSTYV